jgi:FkbM family methyltransferase
MQGEEAIYVNSQKPLKREYQNFKMKSLINLFKYWRKHELASKDLFGTCRRFIKWQIGSRLLGAPVIWPWIGDTKLIVENGMKGATMNIYCGLHEFSDMTFLLHVLKPGDKFVDVGANVGSYTVLASGVAGAESISIEPIPNTFKKLKENILVNKIEDRVRAECCGVGAQDGETITFIADRDTCNQVAPEGYTGSTLDIPIKSLDLLTKDFNAVLWKIDVEGFEEEVLQGAQSALASQELLAVVMEGGCSRIDEIMTSFGFKKYIYSPFSRTLSKLDGNKGSHNWLWIKNADEVLIRCAKANTTMVNGLTI